jgi:hypothetical protein
MQATKISGQPIICQIFSFIPRHLVDKVVKAQDSDKYYKTMSTYKQLIFMLYGVVSKTPSLNTICSNLLFLDGKLTTLGITQLPASSTLSDANAKRSSEVFEKLYYELLNHYKNELKGSFSSLPVNGEVDTSKAKRFDATTFTLFSSIFKGAGRTPEHEKKKGGLKAQTVLAFDSLVPEYIVLGAASKNDKDFLGQLKVEKKHVYVFDKGYVNYFVYQIWSAEGVFFVTRLNDNAKYKVIKSREVDSFDIKSGQGVIKDEEIEVEVNASKSVLRLRLVSYKDPVSGKNLRFLSNHFDYKPETICQLYKNRWAIEPFFKQLKQNFQLDHFYSDSAEGIKTQVWIAFIANLIFTIIYQRNQEAQSFTATVSMASLNLGSYICFLTIIKKVKITAEDRDNEIVQLCIFENMKGGIFEKEKKDTT